MSPSEILFWQRVANHLGINVVTPFEVSFGDGSRLRVSALVKNFGYAKGMLVDADYKLLEPHLRKIIESGYGYSAFGSAPENFDRLSIIEVLKDWGWSGPPEQRPDWLE
jgi:hypothetical protein